MPTVREMEEVKQEDLRALYREFMPLVKITQKRTSSRYSRTVFMHVFNNQTY